MAARGALQTVPRFYGLVRPHLSRIPTPCAITVTRELLPEGATKMNSTLTGNEALLAATLLQLYHKVDAAYRITLGDLTRHHIDCNRFGKRAPFGKRAHSSFG